MTDHVANVRRGVAAFDDQSRYLDRFGLLLIVTIASVSILSLVDMSPRADSAVSRWLETLASLLVGTALLLALRASGVARRWQHVADVIVAVMVGFLLIVAIVTTFSPGEHDGPAAAPILVVILSIVAPLVVMRRLLKHREVRRATLMGAVSAYLLIPIAYFYVYLVLNTVEATPFFGNAEPTTSFMYFSLGNISTAGVGGLEAASNLGRLLSASEAIVGQVYLVTFVALLVGLFAASRVQGDSGG
ncbi:MAG: hypothetical protein PSX37_06270 [bacterium]|nr:hypothetical protein [bacterium]